jgi:predicted enzyme related to lactoylglutathione lyase
MTSAFFNVTFDCRDSRRVAEFWSAVTGYALERVDMPGNEFWLASPPNDDRWPRLVFVTVLEGKVVKNRVHLDLLLARGDQASEVERFRALGASIVDDRRELEPGGWVVRQDPEGNEFCIKQG